MSVLNGNLSEGQTDKKEPPKKPAEQSKTTIAEIAKENAKSEKATIAQTHSSSGDKEKTNTFLRFTFTMDNLVLTLFTGGSQSVNIFFFFGL